MSGFSHHVANLTSRVLVVRPQFGHEFVMPNDHGVLKVLTSHPASICREELIVHKPSWDEWYAEHNDAVLKNLPAGIDTILADEAVATVLRRLAIVDVDYYHSLVGDKRVWLPTFISAQNMLTIVTSVTDVTLASPGV